MAAPHSTLADRVSSHQDLLRALVILVAVVAVMAVLTGVVGFTHTGPSYELIPDPARALGF